MGTSVGKGGRSGKLRSSSRALGGAGVVVVEVVEVVVVVMVVAMVISSTNDED